VVPGRDEPPEVAGGDLVEQVALAADVVVDASPAQAGGLLQVAHTGAVVPVGGEEFGRLPEQLFAALRLAAPGLPRVHPASNSMSSARHHLRPSLYVSETHR